MNLRKLLPWLASALLVLAVWVGVGLATDDGDPPPSDHTTLTVPVPGPDAKVTVDRDNQLEADELREDRLLKPGGPAGGGEAIDLHEDTRDETPAGITKGQVRAGLEEAERTQAPKLDEPQEPAGAQAYSCPPRPVVNQSALSGRRYGVALHFTVSNPGSLDAIRGLFDRPSFGASSNYGFELFNLRCQEWVPVGRKAWAQGSFNSSYVSIEIISNDRSRASWLGSPAFKYGTLAALVRDLLTRTGAPARLVDPAGCTPLAGVVDHDRLECGNSHWDVGRNFPWDVFMQQVRQGVSIASVLLPLERQVARKRCYHLRRSGATNDRWAAHYRDRILVPTNRTLRQLVPGIDAARARDRRPWSFRKRGARRAHLLKVRDGRACR